MKPEKSKASFLGTGWSFPPHFSKDSGSVELVSEAKDIEESISILLATGLGERVMQPDFGCDLKFMLFDELTVTTESTIKEMIETSILYHEPRVDLDNVTIERNELTGKITIDVEYTIRSTNARNNVVFPFYFTEGTDVNL